MSEKTEQATPRKLEEARKEGQVARSEEIPLCVKLIVVYAFLDWSITALGSRITSVITHAISVIGEPFGFAMTDIGWDALGLIFQCVGTLAGALILFIVIANVAQTGPMLAMEALSLKGDKLNPAENIQQIITKDKLVSAAVSIATALCIGTILYFVLAANLRSLQAVSLCGVQCGLELLGVLARKMARAVIMFSVLFAVIDFVYRKYKMSEDQKMTREEVKQERKDDQGDPEIKKERRRLQQEARSGNLAQTVKRSSAVVINPTHIAVCIYYRKGETVVPRVIQKGVDHRAQHIIQLALKAGVPVLRNVPLARSLHAVKENAYIPVDLYRPVAELLAMLDMLRAEGRLPGQAPPAAPEDGSPDTSGQASPDSGVPADDGPLSPAAPSTGSPPPPSAPPVGGSS